MQKTLNQAYGTISSGISDSDLTIALTSGHGARFPSLSAGDWFVGTLSNYPENKIEHVKVTARSTDSLTVVRAWGGSTAQSFSSNDRFSLRWDHTQIMQVLDQFMVGNLATSCTGTNDLTVTFPSMHTVLTSGTSFSAFSAAANTGAMTIVNRFDAGSYGGTLTTLTSKALVKGNNAALIAGDVPMANYPIRYVYNSTLDKYVMLNPASGPGVTGFTLDQAVLNTSVTGSALASQAQMETANSSALLVTPQNQKHHPLHPKVVGRFAGSNGALAFSFGITSVTRNSTGNYTVNFATNFSNSAYAPLIMHSSVSSGSQGTGGFTLAAGSITFETLFESPDGSTTNVDPSFVSISIWGDQ